MAQNPFGNLHIVPGDFGDQRVIELLRTHLNVATSETAVGSGHALDLAGLKSSDVSLWTIWDASTLLGCGALKRLTPTHGELKSMHTLQQHRGKGAGGAMLRHIIGEATRARLLRLSLQTSTWSFFMPAISLYKKHGFKECPPFSSYREDVNSVFLTLTLAEAGTAS